MVRGCGYVSGTDWFVSHDSYGGNCTALTTRLPMPCNNTACTGGYDVSFEISRPGPGWAFSGLWVDIWVGSTKVVDNWAVSGRVWTPPVTIYGSDFCSGTDVAIVYRGGLYTENMRIHQIRYTAR